MFMHEAWNTAVQFLLCVSSQDRGSEVEEYSAVLVDLCNAKRHANIGGRVWSKFMASSSLLGEVASSHTWQL